LNKTHDDTFVFYFIDDFITRTSGSMTHQIDRTPKMKNERNKQYIKILMIYIKLLLSV